MDKEDYDAVRKMRLAAGVNASNRVHRVLLEAEQLQRTDQTEANRFLGEDLECEETKKRLLSIARMRAITLDDLERVLVAKRADSFARAQQTHRFSQSCREQRDDLKVYYVYNTSDRKLTVLAKDAKCARFFAHRIGHIKERENGRLTVLMPEYEAALRKSGKALGRALRAGHPGAVKYVGDNVVMEDWNTVYTPISLVGND